MIWVFVVIAFLGAWAWLASDLKGQNAWHVSQGFQPKSQSGPFIFTVLFFAVVIGLYIFVLPK